MIESILPVNTLNQSRLVFHCLNTKMFTSFMWFHFAVAPHSQDEVQIDYSGVGLSKRQSVVGGLSSLQTIHTAIHRIALV